MSQFDPRVTAYFGDAILQAGFMPLPHLFLRHYRQLGLSAAQAMFILQLMEIAWDKGDAPTTSCKLAARMGVSRRMITTYSQEVQRLGLVEIYDQYAPDGTQTENGYDLSPLFGRLSAFVPAQLPSGEPRSHPRQRVKRMVEPVSMWPVPIDEPASRLPSKRCESVEELAPGFPEQQASSYPENPTSAPRRSELPPAPGTHVRGGLEVSFDGGQKDASRLNKEAKNQNQELGKKNQQQHAAACRGRTRQGQLPPKQTDGNGQSLRWNVALTVDEVRRSQLVLQLLGVNAATVDATAPTLHPAECWGLACYARSRRLGVPWIAQQIYDTRNRRPRLAAQARSFDAVGRLLAGLPEHYALAVLDAVDRSCPNDLEAATDELERLIPDETVLCSCHAPVTALWAAMKAERSTSARWDHHQSVPHQLTLASRATEDYEASSGTTEEEQQLFSATLARLRERTDPAAWDIWLAPLTLLHASDGIVVIGAPNCFVRDEVMSKYADLLAHALEDALGRSATIEIVIGASAPSAIATASAYVPQS